MRSSARIRECRVKPSTLPTSEEHIVQWRKQTLQERSPCGRGHDSSKDMVQGEEEQPHLCGLQGRGAGMGLDSTHRHGRSLLGKPKKQRGERGRGALHSLGSEAAAALFNSAAQI